jgi:hypothetical protein
LDGQETSGPWLRFTKKPTLKLCDP